MKIFDVCDYCGTVYASFDMPDYMVDDWLERTGKRLGGDLGLCLKCGKGSVHRISADTLRKSIDKSDEGERKNETGLKWLFYIGFVVTSLAFYYIGSRWLGISPEEIWYTMNVYRNHPFLILVSLIVGFIGGFVSVSMFTPKK